MDDEVEAEAKLKTLGVTGLQSSVAPGGVFFWKREGIFVAEHRWHQREGFLVGFLVGSSYPTLGVVVVPLQMGICWS